jgi:hypothetical protein
VLTPVRGVTILRAMRALLAVALALSILLGVAAPHVHLGGHGTESCAVCVLRNADVPHGEAPDVAPRVHAVVAVVGAPTPPPVTGAPLGAIPGQSPPAVA